MVRVSHINLEEQLESTEKSNNRLDSVLSKLLQNESIVKYAYDAENEE
jgi:phosphoribosylformylglycinamidine (FGAM) synthase PurS component